MNTGNFTLRAVFFTEGYRYWILMGPDGLPDFNSTLFLTNCYQENRATNTLRNIAYSIRIVREFELKTEISLSNRIENGKILTRSEVAKLISECGKKENNCSKILPFNEKIKSANKYWTTANTQRIRAFYALRYISFLVHKEVETLPYHSIKKNSLECELLRVKSIFDSLSPQKEKENFDPNRPLKEIDARKIIQLTKGQNQELASAIFKQESTRKRNMLIIELLLSTGARISEIANLCIDDIKEESQTIIIQRNISQNLKDTRKNRPGFKTRNRIIQINSDLMLRIANYISARKGGRPRNAKHHFVFCANGRNANALTLSSYYSITRKLEKIFGENWSKTISPHILRHTFFDMWFREANEQYDFKNNPHLFEQVITSAEFTGGWAPDSKMIQHYKQRYIFEQANEITSKTQKRMLQK